MLSTVESQSLKRIALNTDCSCNHILLDLHDAQTAYSGKDAETTRETSQGLHEAARSTVISMALL